MASAEGCTDDAECVATFSGWITDCAAAADCPGQVCIDPEQDGTGKCATAPTAGVTTCDTFGQADFDTTDIDGVAVTVCANTRAACGSNGACELRCTEDTHCENNPLGTTPVTSRHRPVPVQR